MKRRTLLFAVVMLLVLGNVMAQQAPWQGKGRIAVSSDGNEYDHDDWAATPLTLAMLAARGLQDQLVLYTYSDHVWSSNQVHPNDHGMSAYEHMRISALGSKEWFGFENSKFICAVDHAETAYNAMRDVINESSADNPLFIIAAGPMQVVGEGINRSDVDKRQFVTVISHSKWNDNHGDTTHSQSTWDKHEGWTWDKMVEAFGSKRGGKVNFDHISDQNKGEDYLGLRCEIKHYDWIKSSPARYNPKYKRGAWDFLYSRLETCVKGVGKGEKVVDSTLYFDPSDAGIAIYLLTGTQKNSPEDVRKIMENPQ